jgi:uncharacterized protein (TIGR03437 family)
MKLELDMCSKFSALFRAGIVAGILMLASGAGHSQNILGQLSVPDPQGPGGPYSYYPPFAAADGSGNLFIFSNTDGSLHRFDSTGKQLWVSAPVIPPTLQGRVEAMAVTSNGVYLGGQVDGPLSGQTSAGSANAFAQKYDLNGTLLWTREFGTAAGNYVAAIAPDTTGIYVVGGNDGTVVNLYINRYDGDGNQIWARQFVGSPPILSAAADSTGIYFSGFTPASFGYNILRKFDPAGNDLWTYLFDPEDIILGIAPDGQGAYVLYLPSGAPGYSVRRVDLNGAEVWVSSLVSSAYACTRAPGSIVADTNGFYVSGQVATALPGQCYAGQRDVFLMKLDTSGNNTWTRQFGTSGNESSGEIAIGGTSVDVTGFGPTDTADTAFLVTIEKSSAPPNASQPAIQAECVLNAASYVGGGVAPGEIVTILGSALGPAELAPMQVGSDGHIATILAGTQILFDGEPAPLISVSGPQSSAIVPYDVADKTAVNVQVAYNGVLSKPVRTPVVGGRAGIFAFGPSGTGQAEIVNQDGTINSPSNPAARGSVVSIYGTGAGLPGTPGPDDQITSDNPSPFKSSTAIYLTDDLACDDSCSAAEILYYGNAPESVPGLFQINARLPLDAPVGDAVILYFGEQVVTIAIR